MDSALELAQLNTHNPMVPDKFFKSSDLCKREMRSPFMKVIVDRKTQCLPNGVVWIAVPAIRKLGINMRHEIEIADREG